jgi:glycosyltransferase involved in cell wall biosynthesis
MGDSIASVSAREPTVSIVMPVHNAENWLELSIGSILAQTWERWELVAVDDGSTDSSPQLLARYAERDSRIRPVLLEGNHGVANARNVALEAARGDYIAFLDSDDAWHPKKIELQVDWMEQTGVRVSYARYARVSEVGSVLSEVSPPPVLDYRAMLSSNHIGNLTGIIHRELRDLRFKEVGHEDYAFWLAAVKRVAAATCTPSDQPLAFYTVRQRSLSANKLRAARWQWRIYRDCERLGVINSLHYMLRYSINAIRKRTR